MRAHIIGAAAAAAIPFCLTIPTANAADSGIQAVRQEIQALREAYEKRINALEAQLKRIEQPRAAQPKGNPRVSATGGRAARDNSFNPSIGVILNGKATSYSSSESEIAGFGIGEEGERARKGLGIGESELTFSSNVDDKFYGSTTAAIVREGGEDKVELEEAYLLTLPGLGLPDGLRIKAGRAFWTLGYMNERHTHTDDFADRPLPYRIFLNNAFNDDGVEFAWVLPTDFFAEIGGGVFRGDDFPFGESSDGVNAWSLFARIGGDIGDTQSWRLGAYVLDGDADSRASNEDMVTFMGDTRLYAVDLRYTWAPTGNPSQSEVTVQGEYFHRDEDGSYEDADAGTGTVAFNDSSSGWYLQSIYKFFPKWRAGVRYSRMNAPDVPAGLAGSALESGSHDPQAFSIMGDWTSSEFGRIRLQYNYEELSSGQKDNQFILQYVIAFGAHGAHAY